VLGIVAAVGLGAWRAWPRVFPPPTLVVAGGTILETVVATGRVSPLTEVTLANGIPGRIKSVLVKDGDRVEKGQPVIVFDDHELIAEVRTAEARLETARAEVQTARRAVEAARARWVDVKSGARPQEIERARAEVAEARQRAETTETERKRLAQLVANDYVSRSQHDTMAMEAAVAKARLRVAEESLALLLAGPKPETVAAAWSQVAEAESAMARAEVHVRQAAAERDRARAAVRTATVQATVNGKVTKKLVEAGEAVDISMPLMVLGDTSKIIVKADVDETDLGKLRVGQQAEVTADTYAGRVFQAVIYEIAQAVGKRKVRPEDPIKIQDMKVLETKLELLEGSEELKFGMTVDVKIHVSRKDNVLVIPRTLVERGKREAVVSVVGANGPERRQVTLGAADDGWIEVTRGLSAGERLLLVGPSTR
jgi:ABC exporter DevB family membrane fusion protein